MSRLRNRFLSLLLVSISVIQPVAALESQKLQVTEVPRDFMLDGVVEAVNRSTIAAQTGGQITEIHFDVDDFVEKGQVIVRLRDSQQKAALTAAEAQLKQAETALQDAQDTYDRAVKVFDKGAISEADMDKITAALESARAAGEAAAVDAEQDPLYDEAVRIVRDWAIHNPAVAERAEPCLKAWRGGRGALAWAATAARSALWGASSCPGVK